MMFILLLIIFFVLTYLIFYQPSLRLRESFLKTAITFSITIVLITESLSFFSLMTQGAFVLAWLGACLTVGGLCWQRKSWAACSCFAKIPQLSLTEKMMAGGIVFIALIIGFIAASCAPNTWDSMTYHLSRVMHWIQNQTLAPYPTNNLRQLAYCPFGEYGLLQSMILTGTDRFVNFVQFLSMLGSWVVISLIARFLGADRKGQLLAVLMAATLPMGILQGSSTQTDYVATFWICTFIYYTLTWGKEFTFKKGMWSGFLLGLAWLTKGYAYVYTFPCLLILFVKALWPLNKKKVLVFLLLVSIALTLNAGYFMRNWQSSGSIWGKAEVTATTQWNGSIVAANIVRNIGTHLGTSLKFVNQRLDYSLSAMAKTIDSTKQVHEFHIGKISSDEDNAGNLLHVILLFFSFLIWLVFFRKEKLLSQYLLLLMAVGIVFCLCIKWNAYISRYHLPFFILACPWMGVIWTKLKPSVFVVIIAVFVFLSAQLWLWNGNPRRIVGKKSFLKQTRTQQYFIKQKYLDPVYKKLSEHIRMIGCHGVGLQMASNDEWEYPWWVLLKEGGYPLRLEDMGAEERVNVPYPLGGFVPCAILGTSAENRLTYEDYSYFKVVTSLGWSVFIRKPSF